LRNLLSVDSTIARAHHHLANEPADHALGRSRGGLSTKVHALTDRFCCPLTVLLSPGQAGDNPHLKPLLAAHRTGDTAAFRLLADKAYSHPSTRAMLRSKKIGHTIPERSDQIKRCQAEGSLGGRPPTFDAEIYKDRVRHHLPRRRPPRMPDHPPPHPQLADTL
jgi:putative transposase